MADVSPGASTALGVTQHGGAGFGVQIHPASSGERESPPDVPVLGLSPTKTRLSFPPRAAPTPLSHLSYARGGGGKKRDQMDEENLPCWHKAPCKKNSEAFVAQCHPLQSCPSPPESRHSPSSRPHPGREPGAHSGM